MQLTTIVLAGGQAKRMGGRDKGLVPLMGKPLYLHVIERVKPQCHFIQINANRNQEIYQRSGYPVFRDLQSDYPGPLGGILAGLHHSITEWTLFVPCDTPFLPLNLAKRLWQKREDKYIAYTHDGMRSHPTMALIHKNNKTHLSEFLENGNRKLMLFFEQQQAQAVYFNHSAEAFINFNTLAECEQWEKHKEKK